jgi:hypothetical protein
VREVPPDEVDIAAAAALPARSGRAAFACPDFTIDPNHGRVEDDRGPCAALLELQLRVTPTTAEDAAAHDDRGGRDELEVRRFLAERSGEHQVPVDFDRPPTDHGEILGDLFLNPSRQDPTCHSPNLAEAILRR